MAANTSSKLNSLIQLLRLLDSSQGLSPAFIAETLGVTERTVYRYIAALQESGYPIYFDRQISSYRFVDGYKLKENKKDSELSRILDLKSRMLGSSALGLISYDQTGQCIVANEAAAALSGGTRKDLLNQNYHHINSWKHSGLLLMAEKVMNCGQESDDDFHFVTTFGREAWFHFSMSRFEQAGENHLMVVFQDITEKKSAEEKLIEMAQLFKVLANTTMDAFVVIDEDGKLLEANNRACELYGYCMEELLDKYIRDIEADENPEEVRERIQHVLDDGYQRFETRQRTKNGTLIHVEVSTARIPGTNRLLAFMRDITERKQMEQEFRDNEKRFRTLIKEIADCKKIKAN